MDIISVMQSPETKLLSLFTTSKNILFGFLVSMFVLAGGFNAHGGLEIKNLQENELISPIPDRTGLAGMAAVRVMDGSEDVILALGGANFPDGRPWEGAQKVFHKDIYKFADGVWMKIGELPKPVAYAAYAWGAKGMVVAGGCNAEGHTSEVWLVQADGKCSPLPPLPRAVAYPAFTVSNNRLYVMGGQEAPDSTTALNTIYCFDLSNAVPEDPAAKDKKSEIKWEIPMQKDPETGKKTDEPLLIPGEGRILAAASTLNGRIYLMGGCSLAPNAQGGAERTYRNDVLILNPSNSQWLGNGAPIPVTMAASAAPAPAREGKVILIGGDDGSHYGKSPQTHPGQSKTVYLYDPKEDSWSLAGVELKTGLATVPAVVMANKVYTISGETAPGIRTDAVDGLEIGYHFSLYTLDWLVFGLAVVLLTILGFQIKKKGIGNVASALGSGSKPGRYAWIIVAALWVVAMLNYFDRQLLTTIREPIMNDIPQTEAKFGLLTAVFLFIYSGLSPVGGFLADRFSRRIVILVSLTVWSAVTWMTGHVSNYQELFIARALMGISEACYIPAALALITDYHRGSTRSLATGIHMSGVYAGMAIAGYGGTLAEMEGWRITFGLFGFIGVAYALVLIFVLKDPQSEGSGTNQAAEEKTEVAKASFIEALRNLFGQKAFWLLLGVVIGAGAANWLILAWFPTLLKEKFNLSLGAAGIHATLWNTLAKYIAVIIGAIIADQWAKTNLKGRQLLPAIIFVIAGPVIGATAWFDNFSILNGLVTGFGVFILCISFQGLAQGVLDATLMPIMRAHINERYSATGYGFLNLASAGMGGLTVLFGGQLKDQGISLTTIFAFSSVLVVFCGICLFLIPKPKAK